MIPNVVRGSHFRGALDYLFDVQQGARSVKKPTLVCSNMAGATPWELAAEFAVFERMNAKASKPVLHLSLSAHPNDRLTLEQWDELVWRFMALFGEQVKAESKERPISAELNQFVAIRHSDHDHDHVHLLLNRINFDGEVCYCKWDQNRAQAACRQLEHEFGLTLVAGKTEAEQTAQRTLAQAARVAKAAGLPVPAACQRAPKRLSRQEIARLERQQAATDAVDPRLQAYQEQRQLETPVPQPAAVAPASEAIQPPDPLELIKQQQQQQEQAIKAARELEAVALELAGFLKQKKINFYKGKLYTFGFTEAQQQRLVCQQNEDQALVFEAVMRQGKWTAIAGQVPPEVKQACLDLKQGQPKPAKVPTQNQATV